MFVPIVNHKYNGESSAEKLENVAMPKVFCGPIRGDVVERVHDLMMKNTRQPYARMHKAGALCSNKSWGTGRAKARVTRMKASGTPSSGSGARANFCRGGAMFHPLTLNRRWGRPINVKEKRIAVRSAIAASGISSIVQARGHIIDQLNHVPVVVSNDVESITKTKEAVEVLRMTKCYTDVLKCVESKRQRAGRGKMRDRKIKKKRGPLVVFKNDNGITKAFRNIPGVSLMCVDSPNLLKLAPGGHIGRLIIWTAGAFQSLDESLGGDKTLMKPMVTNTCLRKTLKSETVRAAAEALGPFKSTFAKSSYHSARKINPMRSASRMKSLNPFNKSIVQKYKHVMNQISTQN